MMRINGFEQIKAFYSWVFNEPEKARSSHISLYLFLLNQNNRANWVEWFKCPYDLAMHGARIGSKSTYYNCLNDLKEWKIIDYQKGQNNFKAPLIKLFVLYKSVPLSEQVTVPLSEPQTEPQCVPLPVPLTGKKYKLLTDNIELIINNIDDVVCYLNDSFSDNKNLHFNNFWNLYPKKVAKSKCESKFKSLKNKDIEIIFKTLPDFIKYKPFPEYTHPNPLTYLNQERWNDEIKITKEDEKTEQSDKFGESRYKIHRY